MKGKREPQLNQLRSTSRLGFFHKQSELMAMLPEVPKLRSTFDLFVDNGNGAGSEAETETEAGSEGFRCLDPGASIELSDVADCLRTMGLSPSDHWLATRLADHLRRREAMGPVGAAFFQRASFELVLTLYCQLAEEDESPSVEDVLQVLRNRDPRGTGVLPYSELRRMLTTMGDRLEEAEVFSLLHCASDIAGNVHYEHLVQRVFAKDEQAEERLLQARLYLQAVGRNAIDMDMAKRDEFIDALRRSDPMSSGFIEPNRLLELLNRNEERFTGEELQLLTQGMEDTRCERGINYRRFLQFIMNE
ncbi:uncharacterized protein LOC108024113 [Drosophila biarmipes]|uniref:uncharacterized protein LOC108024113 n=1 Tax=Drosophila biarmipes TaxID=125945 RepID=UPI0007E73140|nr:uncharacterized protein LOC108024113 [Drosophila biarmipes]XP_016949382.1 uncharacterized protein LOC108024113 [Drosophila biarmipes]